MILGHMPSGTHRYPYTHSQYSWKEMYTHALHCIHICSLKTRFDHHKALGNVAAPRERQVPLGWLACPGSSGNASDSLEVSSCVLLLCTCSVLHTTSPQPLQCQLISTQSSYSLSALSLQKLLLYTFTANKCACGLRTVCKRQGKGKCNLKGYSPQNCALNALGLNKNLLMEA